MPTTVLFTIAGAAITTGAIAKFIIGMVLSYAVNALLAPRKQADTSSPLSQEARTQTLTQVQPAGNWDMVYGQVRKGGTLVFRHVTDIAGMQTHSEDHVIPAVSPYTVSVAQAATYSSTTGVDRVTVVQQDEGADYVYEAMTADVTPGDGEYAVTAGVYTFNAAQAGQNVRITYTAASGAVASRHLHLVIVVASHEIEAIDTIYFDADEVPLDGSGNATGKYAGHVYIAKHLGNAGDAADPVLVAAAPGKWTSAHTLTGHAYLYVRLLKNAQLFASGVPNITVLMRGKNDIYDPRDASTGYSQNAALCLANYFCDTETGLAVDYADGIGESALIAAANVCDEAVTLAAGGSEDRYTCNGVIDAGLAPQEIIGRMLGAMAGRAVYIGGQWHIHAGAYITPAHTFTEDHFAGPVQVSTRLSRRDSFNGVKGVYVSPQNNWQPSDFPAVASSAYMTEDGGQRIWKDIDLPFTTSPATAQRLAKIELLRARQQISVTAPMKMHAYQAQPPETVALTFERYGWSAKAFELAELRLQMGEAMSVQATLRETASTVYDWSSSEESTVDDAPNTTLPNPFVVLAPGAPSATETIYQSFGSGVKAKAVVTWTASADAQARTYELQWKRRDDTDWQEATALTTPRFEIADIDADDYLLRVRALNAIGVASLWTQSEITFTGLSAPPAAVEWFVIDGATLAWRAPNDLDVSGYKLRFHYGTNTSWGDANALHGGLISESPFTLVPRPAGQVTLMIKPVDALGNESVGVAYIVTDLGDADVANMVETIDLAALSWPGTLTQGTESGGELLADDASGLAWDANENTAGWTYDSAPGWDADVYEMMTYLAEVWPTEAGAGSVMTLTHDITASAYSIEYRRQAPASAWTLDTEAGWTDDADPGWSTPDSWQPWPGSIVALNEPYDVRVITAQSGTRGTITDLIFTIDMPDITEHFEDVVIASGGTRLPITQTYRAIKTVSVTVQSDGNNGIGERVIDKDAALGPQIKVYDAAGSAVTGLIDATIRGY